MFSNKNGCLYRWVSPLPKLSLKLGLKARIYYVAKLPQTWGTKGNSRYTLPLTIWEPGQATCKLVVWHHTAIYLKTATFVTIFLHASHICQCSNEVKLNNRLSLHNFMTCFKWFNYKPKLGNYNLFTSTQVLSVWARQSIIDNWETASASGKNDWPYSCKVGWIVALCKALSPPCNVNAIQTGKQWSYQMLAPTHAAVMNRTKADGYDTK